MKLNIDGKLENASALTDIRTHTSKTRQCYKFVISAVRNSLEGYVNVILRANVMRLLVSVNASQDPKF